MFARREETSDWPSHDITLKAALEAYQHWHQLSDSDLARHLRMPESQMPRLRAARPPRQDHFPMDLLAIARSVGCDASRLWSVLTFAPEQEA